MCRLKRAHHWPPSYQSRTCAQCSSCQSPNSSGLEQPNRPEANSRIDCTKVLSDPAITPLSPDLASGELSRSWVPGRPAPAGARAQYKSVVYTIVQSLVRRFFGLIHGGQICFARGVFHDRKQAWQVGPLSVCRDDGRRRLAGIRVIGAIDRHRCCNVETTDRKSEGGREQNERTRVELCRASQACSNTFVLLTSLIPTTSI